MSVAVGHAPAHERLGVRRVEDEVDDYGGEHAAQRAENRQDGLADVGELAGRHLVLDLEADEQEEHGHEDVVDDVRKRHLAVEGPDADGDLRVPELEEGPCAGVLATMSAMMAATSMMAAAFVDECVNWMSWRSRLLRPCTSAMNSPSGSGLSGPGMMGVSEKSSRLSAVSRSCWLVIRSSSLPYSQ